MMWSGNGGWWMLWGGFWMLAFWLAFIAGTAWIIAWIWRSTTRPGQTPSQSPLDIAKARYARGEISKEEFERLKKDLTS